MYLINTTAYIANHTDDSPYKSSPTFELGGKGLMGPFKVNTQNGVMGMLGVTSKRLIYVYNVLFFHSVEIIPLSEIRSFSCKMDNVSHIEINTMIKKYDFNIYARCGMGEIQNAISTAIENDRKSLNIDNKQAANTDYISQIERLFELKEKGVITEDEFEKKRKELLV